MGRAATGLLKVTGEDDRDKKQLKDLFASHILRQPKFFDHADSQNLYTLEPVTRAGPGFLLHRGADDSLLRWAIREIQFLRPLTVSLLTLDETVAPGDWLLTHAGFALSRLTRDQALEAARIRSAVEDPSCPPLR